MTIRLPHRHHIRATTAADPMKFYYVPAVGAFYRARFVDAVRLLGGPVDSLLDYGCGSGIFLPELSRWCRRLYACDLHNELDKVARMLRDERVGATLLQTDGTRLPFADASFDAIVSMSVLEHVRDPSTPIREFHRVLKPGGVIVAGVPVANLLTLSMFRLSYLTLTARLEDEHVSTDRDVLRALDATFTHEGLAHIPRRLPHGLRMYTTARLTKPRSSAAVASLS